MKQRIPLYLFILFVASACGSDQGEGPVYESESLIITQLTENTFIHTSFLNFENFQNVPCNGMIVINEGEALVFDTPVGDPPSDELIDWLENIMHLQVKGVVATHFHYDCTGGLDAFHERQIPSYGSNRRVRFANADGVVTAPQNGFDEYLELSVGNTKVINQFPGEGHTRDNIIIYFPDDKVMFGGCLIKSDGAGKGNLNDANVNAWPITVSDIQAEYVDAEIIIPGHGRSGGQELLDYTIKLFQE